MYQYTGDVEYFSCVIAGEGGPPDTTFIEDAVHELLKTRRILKCSYPYGFFLEPKSTKKEIFELMQVSNTRASSYTWLLFWVSDDTLIVALIRLTWKWWPKTLRRRSTDRTSARHVTKSSVPPAWCSRNGRSFWPLWREAWHPTTRPRPLDAGNGLFLFQD